MPAAMVLQLMGSLSQSEDDEDDDDDNNNTARVGAQPRDNDEEGSEEEGQQQNCAISWEAWKTKKNKGYSWMCNFWRSI